MSKSVNILSYFSQIAGFCQGLTEPSRSLGVEIERCAELLQGQLNPDFRKELKDMQGMADRINQRDRIIFSLLRGRSCVKVLH